jgi:hypothetical protein
MERYFVNSQEMKEEIEKALNIERHHLFDALGKMLKTFDDRIKSLEEKIKSLEKKGGDKNEG